MKIQSILVATDLTEASDHVLRVAAALAALSHARLHVLHAFEFENTAYSGQPRPSPTFQEHIAQAERALDEQIQRTVGAEVEVASREIIIFVAYKAIRDRAQAVNADLIVLGRHRRRGVADAFLGGTADRLIRSSAIPCLIVHGPLSLPLRRVVVPIDLSAPALKALDLALEWTVSLGPSQGSPEIVVLHVIARVFDFAAVPADRAPIGAELQRQVDAARVRAGVEARARVSEVVRWSDSTADEILKVAQQEKADLLVLGTHGYGAFKRALIGSVAAAVARAAECPVLLVPPALWAGESD